MSPVDSFIAASVIGDKVLINSVNLVNILGTRVGLGPFGPSILGAGSQSANIAISTNSKAILMGPLKCLPLGFP